MDNSSGITIHANPAVKIPEVHALGKSLAALTFNIFSDVMLD